MKNSYELVFILDPDLTEEDREKSIEKHKGVLSRYEGTLVEEHFWGRRRLAYEINDKEHGYYYIWYIQGDGTTIAELQKRFGYSDEVLRFQTVRIEDIQEESSFFQSLLTEKTPEDQATDDNDEASVNGSEDVNASEDSNDSEDSNASEE